MKKVPAECYSRVVGFFRPINQWNPGKTEEFRQRKTYKIPEDLNEYQKSKESRGTISK